MDPAMDSNALASTEPGASPAVRELLEQAARAQDTDMDAARQYALQARVRIRTTVLRDGQPVAVPLREVVPGDVVMLSAGSLVPADAVLVAATDCFVNEAVLTGESFPVEKRPGVVDATAGLGARTN